MPTVKRIDRAGSFMTTFIFTNGNEGSQIQVPIDQADDYETAIQAASWTTLNNLFNQEGESVVKSS